MQDSLFNKTRIMCKFHSARWATGTKSMSESAQYPLAFGRAMAFAFELVQKPGDDDAKIEQFVNRLIASLPPPGELLPEAQFPKTVLKDAVSGLAGKIRCSR